MSRLRRCEGGSAPSRSPAKGRAALGTLVALLLWIAPAQAQTLVTRIEIGLWSGTVWLAADGKFSHCAVSAPFRSELITLSLTHTVFSLGVSRTDAPPLYDPDADLPANRARSRLAVDDLWSEEVEGERIGGQTVAFDLAPWTTPAAAGLSPAIQALRTGRKLTIQGGRRAAYPLDDAKIAIDWLIACRQSADRR